MNKLFDYTSLTGKEVILLSGKTVTIKEVRVLDNIALAYFGEQGIVNAEVLRDKNGEYLVPDKEEK